MIHGIRKRDTAAEEQRYAGLLQTRGPEVGAQVRTSFPTAQPAAQASAVQPAPQAAVNSSQVKAKNSAAQYINRITPQNRFGGGGGRDGNSQTVNTSGTGTFETAKEPSVAKLLGGAALKGLDQAMGSLTGAADLFVGRNITNVGKLFGQDWSGNPISALNERMNEAQETNQTYFQGNVDKFGKVGQAVDKYGTMTAAAVPQALMAMATAGGSGAAEGLKAAANVAPGVLASIKTGTQAMLRDPQYWLSFFSTVSDSAEQARADGADDVHAALYAMTNSLFNAGVEVGGGIQTLPKELRAGKTAALEWVKSMVDEGKEEVVQGVLERGLQNLIYQKENPTFSTTDPNAVFNPRTAAEEFTGGAVVGGLLGGGQILAGRAIDAAEQTAQSGRVSNSMAERVLADNNAISILEETAGLVLTDSMSKSQRRAAVKSAVEALARQNGEVSQGTMESVPSTETAAQNEVKTKPAQAVPELPQQTVQSPAQQLYNIQRIRQETRDMGRFGSQVAVDFYDGTIDTAAYYGAFSAYHYAGMTGKDMADVKTTYANTLNSAQQEAAYEAGRYDAESAAQIAENKETVYDGVTNPMNQEEAQNYGETEGVHLRDSGQRLDRTDSRGELSGVAGRAGQDTERAVTGRPADREAAAITYGKEVSTGSLGIAKGANRDRIREVVGGETAATREAKRMAKEHGLRAVLFGGNNLTFYMDNGTRASVRGFVSQDRVFIRADHPEFTSDQIMRHEVGHSRIARGEIDPNAVRERIAKKIGTENLDELARMYEAAYRESGLSAERVWEEVICDSLGDMNVFAGTILEKPAGKLLDEVKKEASAERRTNQTRGPPARETGEERYSLEGYSEHQIENWKNSKSIVIYKEQEQLRRFIQESIDGNNLGQKIYFGAVSTNLAAHIKAETGLDVEGYNCSISAYEIRKILKNSHGDAQREALRGQRPVTADDIMAIPEILTDSDSITLSDKTYEGKPVIVFTKTVDGRTTVVSYASSKHMDLIVQTMYAGIKEGSLATPPNEVSPVLQTSKTTSGTASNNSIPQSIEKGKDQSSQELQSVEELRRENERLREKVTYWKGQTKRTTRKTVSPRQEDVNGLAQRLIGNYGSTIKTTDISADLKSLGEFIMRGGDGKEQLTWTSAREKALNVAQKLVENAVEVNDEAYRQYSDLRKYLRTTKIKVPRSLWSELDAVGGFYAFRKANMGRMSLSSVEGTGIDQAYQEFAGMYPEFFDEERVSNPADQLVQMAEVLDGLQPIYRNPFNYDMAQATEYAANDILDSIMGEEVRQTPPTFADRQALDKQEAVAAQRLADDMYAGRKAAELYQKNQEQAKRALQRERTRRTEQIDQLKERFRDKEIVDRERRSAAELRRKITKHTADLSQKLLKPNDKHHIPEELRGAVASMLEAINQESQYTIDQETGKRTKAGDGLPVKRTQAFLALKEQYAKISAIPDLDMVIDPSLFGNDAEDIKGNFDQVIAMHDTRLADMSTAQLGIVWQVVRAVEHSVSTAGKVLSQTKFTRTQEWANAMMADTSTRRNNRKAHMLLDMETPYTFFSHYGDAGKAVYRMLRDAQDRQQLMVNHVAQEVQKIVDPGTVQKFERETHKFTTVRGKELTLSTAQIMEIYELMQREHAQEHLMKGGIVQPEIKSAKINRGTEAILLTAKDLTDIVGKLTDEQVKIADRLQQMMTGTLADYSNEASMTAYGYKKFTETDYWPIKSAKEGVYSEIERGGNNTRSIKNIGLARSVVPHASNALDIAGVFSTFSAHAADMTDYAAWLCTTEDANRLFNYKYQYGEGSSTSKTVKGLLEDKGGIGAEKYWRLLMEDIQNGIGTPSDSQLAKAAEKIIGNAKGAAVGANLRVVIQQPTAFFRAAAVLSPADLTRGLAGGVTPGSGWKKAMQYSPIAMRKDMGGFDISSPLQMDEILFDGRTSLRKLNDALSAPAGKADAVTWGKLWNACEWATEREHGDLAKGSEEFYQAVNKQFTEVIDQTQVVDGVLQRSQVMRSSNGLSRQATSFMGEPIMSYNLLQRAYDQLRYEQEPKRRSAAIKTLGRAATALLVTDLVNALAQSLIDALRDDDKDKKYWERFWAAFTGIEGDEESAWDMAAGAILNGNFGSNINPIGRIPFLKDGLSLLQGYRVERLDISAFGDFFQAAQALMSDKYTRPYAVKQLAASAAKIFSVSAGNLTRDIWGIARSAAVETANIPLQFEMEKAIFSLTSESNKGKYMDILFNAMTQGDMESYDHIRSELMEQMGVDGTAIDNAMRSRYDKAVQKDPGFTMSQEARDLIGSRDHYAVPEEKDDAFGADSLGASDYQDYTTQRASDYRQMADGLENHPIFQGMSPEARDNVLSAAYDLANKTALEDASDGQYKVTTKWMTRVDDAERLGIEPWEYVLFHEIFNQTESTKGADGKEIKGETKGDHVREELEDFGGLTERQREFLWGTVYKSEW